MPLVDVTGLEWGQLPIFRQDVDNQITIRDGSRYGLDPFMNLDARMPSSSYNLTWVPQVPKWPSQTIQEGRAYSISDEIVRQVARAAQTVNNRLTFFKTATQ